MPSRITITFVMRVNEPQQHAFLWHDSMRPRRSSEQHLRNTNYPAQSGEENIEPSLLTIVNHTIQCTNTNTDDAGNA